jgi:TPR repeat protein
VPASEIPHLERRAEQGDSKAAIQLANHYGFVEMNFDQSMRWLRRAADLGDPLGQFNLAQLLWHDAKTPEEKKEAIVFYRLAAQQGFERAKAKLAEIESEPNQSSTAQRP